MEKKLMARDAEVIEEVEEKIFKFKRDYEEMKYEK